MNKTVPDQKDQVENEFSVPSTVRQANRGGEEIEYVFTIGRILIQYWVSYLRRNDTIQDHLQTKPPAIRPFTRGETRLPSLEEQLLSRDHTLGVLRQNLLKVQINTVERSTMTKRTWFSSVCSHIANALIAQRVNQKLSLSFFGPYRVLHQIGKVAYELDLPHTSKLHPVFYVSLIKPAQAQSVTESDKPPPINDSFELTLQPESTVDHGWRKFGDSWVLELLVRWIDRHMTSLAWRNMTYYSCSSVLSALRTSRVS
ncbi:hypothetical protein V2J09_016661 [Rumex salicifolius]